MSGKFLTNALTISQDDSNILKAIAVLTVIITHANGFSHSFISDRTDGFNLC